MRRIVRYALSSSSLLKGKGLLVAIVVLPLGCPDFFIGHGGAAHEALAGCVAHAGADIDGEECILFKPDRHTVAFRKGQLPFSIERDRSGLYSWANRLAGYDPAPAAY